MYAHRNLKLHAAAAVAIVIVFRRINAFSRQVDLFVETPSQALPDLDDTTPLSAAITPLEVCLTRC